MNPKVSWRNRMLFLVTYQVDRDKQIECQTFFANMTDEQIENEYPTSVKQIGRWHDVPNGNGVIIVETDNQENLTSWMMSWSSMCTFPLLSLLSMIKQAENLLRNL